MPRLGSAGAPSPPRRRRSPQSPLQRIFGNYSSRPLSPRNVLLFLIAFFVMRNLLRRDYRREEIQYLRDSGMNDEQVHRIVPRTSDEQRKNIQDKTNDVEKMKKDIVYLLNEVAELKARSIGAEQQQGQLHNAQANISTPSQPNGQTGGIREDELISMDKIHQEKRQRQEEELMKANPDFHASKRLKDMTEEEVQKALKK
jgi:hypothetical protein